VFINPATPNYIIQILKKSEISSKDKGILKGFYGINYQQKLGFKTAAEEIQLKKKGAGKDEINENIDEISLFLEENREYINEENDKIGGCCSEFIDENDINYDINYDIKGGADDIFISEEDILLKPEILTGDEISSSEIKKKTISISEKVKDKSTFKKNKMLTFGPQFIFDVSIFPEDNIFTLKEKIFLVTGVPIYRQHLFWSGGISGRETSYILYTESGQRTVDILQAFKKCGKEGGETADFTVPIDIVLYNNREQSIKIECLDYFKLLAHCHIRDMTFFVVDIAQFFDDFKTQLDTYRLDLYYYGFVMKFWPMITRDIFLVFLENEEDIIDKYPEMARPEHFLKDKFGRESSLLNMNYGQANKVIKMSHSLKIKSSIISLIGTVTPIAPTLLSLRNLFDYVNVTRCFPESHCYVSFEGYNYHLRKINIQNRGNITFPPDFRSGFVFAVSLHKMDQDSFHARESKMTLEKEQTRYLFLNILENGSYNIKSVWNEEEEQSFESIISIIQRFINPIINMINAAGSIIFSSGELPLVTTKNILIKSVTANIIWNKFINETKFKNLAMFWDEYVRAGIIENRTIVSSGRVNNRYDYLFKKGMYNFSSGAVENNLIGPLLTTLQNQYSHLSVNNAWQRWKQFYGGRMMSMIHRTSDVKFEIFGVNPEELSLFNRYIYVFLAKFICLKESGLNAGPDSLDKKNVKKIKKLKEVDPELYNLKKYGYKRAYSVICQNPKQPVVFSDDEIAQMTSNKKGLPELYKYWNFTTGKEAFYSCPNPKYPYLFFITGVHPKNYCLPCCKKTADVMDGKNSKSAAISAICAKKHFFDKNIDLSELQFSGKQRHIINYGRSLEDGRIARLPNELVNTLFQEQENLIYVLFGVKQSLPAYPDGDLGLIFSLAECLQLSVSELAKGVIETLKNHPKLLASISGGGIIEKFFESAENLFYLLDKIFISQEAVLVFTDNKNKGLLKNKMKGLLIKNFHAKDWCNLFLEVAAYRLNTYVIIFEDITLSKLESDDSKAADEDIIQHASAKEAIFNVIIDKKLPISPDQIASLRPGTKIIFIINKAKNYYPIFFIDDKEYYKNKVPKSRFFSHKSPIFTSIMNEVSNDKSGRWLETQKLTFDNLVEFTKNSKNKYVILEKYVNLNGLCYGSKIKSEKGMIFAALHQIPYRSDNFCITFAPITESSDTIALFEFQKDFNKWIIGKSSGASIIIFNKKIIGGEGKKYLLSDEGLWPVKDFSNLDDSKNNIPLEEYSFDISQINTSIYKWRTSSREVEKTKNNWRERLPRGLYKNYLYQLFIIQFINEMHNNHKNMKARQKIRDIFCGRRNNNINNNINTSAGGTDDLFESLQKIDGMTTKDATRLSILLQNISSSSMMMTSTHDRSNDYKKIGKESTAPKELFNIIDNSVWDFDKKELFDLIDDINKQKKEEEILEKLRNICSKFVIINEAAAADLKITKFPNILTSCNDSIEICKGKKLLLPSKEIFEKYIELLAADLKNPLKVKMILIGYITKNIINFFDFRYSQYEKIYIEEI
jgi:hypothetical protein